MELIEFLNTNPALLSIVGFPFGILLLLASAKALKLDGFFKQYLKALQDHTAAEVKIEERLQDVVMEIRKIAQSNLANRDYFEIELKWFREKIIMIDDKIKILVSAVKKRRGDWLNENDEGGRNQ